jgi:hypothetical protein
MNGDAFKRVRQGDSMEIQAAAWNACLDAAEAAKRGGGGLADAVGRQFRQADIVLVKNASGSDVSRFHVLGISGVIFTPTDSLPSFQNQVAFTGVTPTTASHAGKFLVCLDALKNGQIGRAWIAGVAQVQVNVASSSDAFCDVKNSDRTQLQSAPSGTARILWKESGTGTKWAVVRINDPSDPVRLGKTSSTWTKNTTATIDLWEGGTPPSETSSSATLANCVNKMVTVPSGRWVEVAQGVNGYWYLVWAEPEQLTVLTGVSLTGSGLVFTRKTINTYVDSTTPADVTITTTSCPT